MSWLPSYNFRAFSKCGSEVKISDKAIIIGANNIEIGDNVRIDAGAILMAGGIDGSLRIGNHIHIAAGAILMAAGGIRLGDFSTVGIGSKIISATDDFSGDYLIGPSFGEPWTSVKKAEVVLESHAIITTSCVVLPGARMCEGSVLGAMSLAKGFLKPWRIYAGIPAKEIKTRTERAGNLGVQYDAQFRGMFTQPSP